MSRFAPSEYPIHDFIATRWSPRAYSNRPVPNETLLSILEAARWAASSYGAQPWSYIIATRDNPAEYERLLSVLVPFNQGWASSAPVLLLSVASTVNADGKPNHLALHDVGAASAQLSLQATALGLQAHQMAGIDSDKAKELYELPEGTVPVAAIALGYVGDPRTLPDALKEREVGARERKPLSSFVFTGKYGEASPLAK